MTKNNIFPSALLLIFITLKLCKVIDWSWLWVMAPFWIPAVFALLVLVFGLIVVTLNK